MGKVIAAIIVVLFAVGAWYIFSQTSETVTPTRETVNEPIDQARDLENKATNPARDTLSE